MYELPYNMNSVDWAVCNKETYVNKLTSEQIQVFNLA